MRPLHRVIVERRQGRALRSDEIVRHLDGDTLNNDPANLVVVTRAEHFQLSMTPTSKRPWTHAEVERALALYQSGNTVAQVAHALGRSYYATRRQLRKWLFLRRPEKSTLAEAVAAKARERIASDALEQPLVLVAATLDAESTRRRSASRRSIEHDEDQSG